MTDVETCSTAVETVSLEDRGSSSPAPQEGDHDSGVDESTQAKEPVGKTSNTQKTTSRIAAANPKRTSSSPTSPSKGPVPTGPSKMPMNKVQVGCAPSPNLKTVTSKIGSMANAAYKPGGGNVKIETQKIKIEAKSRVGTRNEGYVKAGGDKKIQTVKLQWNAQSKIGSLGNSTHKPGGGDKKIESRKLDFKDKAKSKVGSTTNIKHAPGGGNVKTPTTPENELATSDDETGEEAGEEAINEGEDLDSVSEVNESEEIAGDQENDAIIIELDTDAHEDVEVEPEAIPEVDETQEAIVKESAPVEEGAPAEEVADAE